MDLPFSSSLTPGVYAVAINISSQSTSAGTTVANMTSCIPRASLIGNSMPNQAWGAVGAFPGNTGKMFPFFGTVSTAGSATTASIPLSVISSVAAAGMPFLQINVGSAN
jgi:hypothetical protein